ncbi:S1/P1 nuclease [Pararhizobium antarcticum]|uniref:S1/P1 Nuclease n=1 Tax=Pararhizobium antarcticum TaxID=1798805 RepID=A0A657LV91_9HYPH|nr:S1/P1 nuclease [Pararhizobium antarcticum]OJF98716.1 hypothetical protein AX760_01340 [Pararhizobium antarcticum]OJF98896.1 hypothetical protein AX760_02470 [Pararhizobium antarcticum]OJF99137.1 hypothetical protein AX761_11770 [Rhizobium sp. 58]
MQFRRLILIVVACLSLWTCTGIDSAFAWGTTGHRVVALIAERHLTPVAREAVSILLDSEGKASMADVAMWADDVRSLKIPVQPLHTVRIPLDHKPYDPAMACPKDRCVLAAIEASTVTLADPEAPTAARMAALKYLVHFIGDLHQPLHASADTGEERVVSEARKRKLHWVWDVGIIRAQDMNAHTLAGLIDADRRLKVSTRGTPVDWALEGRNIARDQVFPPLRGWRVDGTVQLPATYALDNWPVVRLRLKQAGLRLARLLNENFR